MKTVAQFASKNSGWLAVALVANALVAVYLLLPRKENGQWQLLGALMNKQVAGQAQPGAGENAPGPIVAVSNVNVMLHSGNADYFVAADFALELANEQDRAIVDQRLRGLREASIGFLSGIPLDQLRGSSGIERTKITLLQTFRKVVPAHVLKAVYVTNLVVD